MTRRTLRITVAALTIGTAAVFAGGCETAEGTALMGTMMQHSAASSASPDRARARQGVADWLFWSAGHQSQKEVQATPQTIRHR